MLTDPKWNQLTHAQSAEVPAFCRYPFDLKCFFRLGKSLNDILEMQFDLMYYLHMSIADFNENDARDNEWLHSRLVKQKNEEIEAKRKHGRSGE